MLLTSRKSLLVRKKIIAGYLGPGDVVAAQSWYGLRAYSNAKALAGAPAVNLIGVGGPGATDIHLLPNGKLNTSDPWFGLTGPPYVVNGLYDQLGVGLMNLMSAGATLGFILSDPLTGLPAMTSVKASNQQLVTAGGYTTTAPPYSLNLVANHATGATAQANAAIIFNSAATNAVALSYRNTAINTTFYFDGTNNTGPATATDGVWNSVFGSTSGVTSGTGTIIAVNATQATSTNLGAIAFGTAPNGVINLPLTGTNGFDGSISEFGIWNVALSSSQITALYNQQHLYYGVF